MELFPNPQLRIIPPPRSLGIGVEIEPKTGKKAIYQNIVNPKCVIRNPRFIQSAAKF